MVSKKRHGLNDKSIRAGTLLASWAKSGIATLLPEAELVSAIKAKARRPKKTLTSAEGQIEIEDEPEDM